MNERRSPQYSGGRPAGGAATPRTAEFRRPPTDNVSQGTLPQAGAERNESRVEVLSLRPVTGLGPIKAFVELRVGEILVRDAKVIQQAGQRAWVAPPDKRWTGSDGEPHYTRLVEFAKPLQQRVSAVVLAAWERADG
jgi:hypothetical protein